MFRKRNNQNSVNGCTFVMHRGIMCHEPVGFILNICLREAWNFELVRFVSWNSLECEVIELPKIFFVKSKWTRIHFTFASYLLCKEEPFLISVQLGQKITPTFCNSSYSLTSVSSTRRYGNLRGKKSFEPTRREQKYPADVEKIWILRMGPDVRIDERFSQHGPQDS